MHDQRCNAEKQRLTRTNDINNNREKLRRGIFKKKNIINKYLSLTAQYHTEENVQKRECNKSIYI